MADLEAVRQWPLIAVNDVYRIAPWAVALVAADASWWHVHNGAQDFVGEQWSIEHSTWDRYRERWPRVKRLRNTGDVGVDTNPTALRTGRNSGYLALGLAVHYGATRIVLLGYDMQATKGGKRHFFGNHPGAMNQASPYHAFRERYEQSAPAFAALGIDVINCTRATALTCFRRVPLEDVVAVAA